MGRKRGSVEWLVALTPHIPYTRERGVWMAVLWQALLDYTTPNPEDKTDKARIQRKAKEWLQSDIRWFGSFKWVCDALDLNTDRLRTLLETSPDELGKELRARSRTRFKWV